MTEQLILYGIKTCSTVRKAKQWLEEHHVPFTFYDYKVQSVTVDQIEAWVLQVGWKVLLNRAGTTFRNLSDSEKKNADTEITAVALMAQYPTLIKRPVLVFGEKILVGFKPEQYATLLGCG
ncbi:MAG: arsenate reductase [Acetobacter sp.]|nr:arsenate reductase [Acetobacter sp.]